MDRINGLNQIMEALRQRFSSNVSRANKSSTTNRSATAAHAGKKKKLNIKELESLISDRLQVLEKENKNHEQYAAQVFIESVVAWEFGENVLNDPKFPEMTREICNQMTNDHVLSKKLTTLIKQFLQ